jgi:hypothetical protein
MAHVSTACHTQSGDVTMDCPDAAGGGGAAATAPPSAADNGVGDAAASEAAE